MSLPQAGDTQGNLERGSQIAGALPVSAPAASSTDPTNGTDAQATAHTDWLAASFDALVDGTAIMDCEGSIVRMNRTGRALLGLDSDEAVASFFRLPPEQRVKHFDMRDEQGQPLTVERLPQNRILRGEVLAGPSAMEVYIAARDGHEMIWSFEGAPIRDATGNVTGGAVTFRDITAAKRLQIEHERLLEQEQAARAEAEAVTAELRALQSISDVALRHHQLDALLRELLTRTCEAMAADNTAILLLTEDGRRLAVHMAFGPEVESVGHVYVPVGEGIAGRIAATRQPVIVDDLSAAQPVNPLLRERLRSLVGVPLLIEDRLIGVMHVDSATPRQFTQRDINFLQLAADRIAQAIEQARLYRAEQVARREAEIANERLQAVLDVLPVGVVFTDDQGRFLQINDAMRAIWGQDAPYLSGVPDYGAYVGWWPDTERLIAADEWALARALLSGEVVFDEEIPIQAFDGARKTIRTGAAPMRDEHGATIGAVCITEDITERKRLERDLAEQANQLATIFETMSDAVVLYDREGCILRANPATLELLGTSGSPEFLTMPLRERVQPLAIRDAVGQPLPTEELPVTRVLRGEVLKGSTAVEMRVRAFDGRERDFSVRGAPLREADGRIAGAVLVFQDVSERQRLIKSLGERATQLEVANREMDDLIGIVTHELRTPLTSLKANLQIALRRLSHIMEDYQQPSASPDSDQPAIAVWLDNLRTLLTKTEAQSLRLERMVSDLLDTSRAQRGALDLAPEACDLAAIVREIVEEQRQAHPARTIRLTTPKGAVPIVADAQRIGQVLTNYLSNAHKYAPADQPVEVTLRVARQHARVAVRDHGPGLALKEQQHIWERFHRVPGAEVSDDAGPQANLGLGLYICKNIVEGHGGRIGVSSRPGDGAIFWFSLPLAPTSWEPTPSPQ